MSSTRVSNPMKQKEQAIIRAINEIVNTGTRIVSFTWYGKRVNATIGSNRAYVQMSQTCKTDNDEVINRAIVMDHDNDFMLLFGLDNNRRRCVFSWKLSSIKNASFLKREHFNKGLIGWLCWKLSAF